MFGGRKSQWTLYSSDLNIIKLFANDIKIVQFKVLCTLDSRILIGKTKGFPY